MQLGFYFNRQGKIEINLPSPVGNKATLVEGSKNGGGKDPSAGEGRKGNAEVIS